jgi:hypothetical protein
MKSGSICLLLFGTLVLASSAQAQVVSGVMTVTGAEMH